MVVPTWKLEEASVPLSQGPDNVPFIKFFTYVTTAWQRGLFRKQTFLSHSLSRRYTTLRNYLQRGFLPCRSVYPSVTPVLSQRFRNSSFHPADAWIHTPLSSDALTVPECLQKASILGHSFLVQILPLTTSFSRSIGIHPIPVGLAPLNAQLKP